MEGRCGGRVLAATLAREVKMKKPLGRDVLAACPVLDDACSNEVESGPHRYSRNLEPGPPPYLSAGCRAI